jgi:1-acyl-sn-glycerol-3-phosphate acyltransferase
MTEPSPPAGAAASPGHGLARALRYCYRVPWLLWHLLVPLPLTILALTLTAGMRVGGERLDHRLIRAWSVGLLRVFGFRVHRTGTPLAGATLFVAKREIARWPVVGWMARRAETIFHERGSTESLGGVLDEMLVRLRSGHSVGVFPEGRTRDGRQVGPFHARIFLAAVESGAPVQPVALRYGVHGDAQGRVAFQPGEHFLGNFLRLLGEPARPAEVCFLAPIVAAMR